MRRHVNDRYVCDYCGALIDIGRDEVPREVLHGSSGQKTMRVLAWVEPRCIGATSSNPASAALHADPCNAITCRSVRAVSRPPLLGSERCDGIDAAVEMVTEHRRRPVVLGHRDRSRTGIVKRRVPTLQAQTAVEVPASVVLFDESKEPAAMSHDTSIVIRGVLTAGPKASCCEPRRRDAGRTPIGAPELARLTAFHVSEG